MKTLLRTLALRFPLRLTRASAFTVCARRAGLLLFALLCLCVNPVLADHTRVPAAKPGKTNASKAFAGLDVSNAWVRAMPPGAGVASAYLKLRNVGKKELQVVSLSSPMARSVEIHDMKISHGQMQMRQLKDGLRIPAGQIVELAPGGLHLMLIDISQDFMPGLLVPVQLVLADVATLDLKIPVRDATQNGQAHQH